MANHIVENPRPNETLSMKKWLLRTTVALLSLSAGVFVSLVVRSLVQLHSMQPVDQPPAVVSPKLDCAREAPPEYPDNSDLSPSQIEYFINNTPEANLARLWKRLGRNAKSETHASDFTVCNSCKAESSEFNLDGEPGNETVLKISKTRSEAFRYLIFKYGGGKGRTWRVIGDVDEWGKYRDSKHMVVFGNGRPLLLTQGQGASGSGVSLFINRIFLVSPDGIKEILSFPSDGHQSGAPDGPDRNFTGQLVSYLLQDRRIELTLQFRVSYAVTSSAELEFSKAQTAVYSGPIDKVTLQRHKSTISEREIEHIYNIDSMTEMDFLKYNYSELLNLASHGNQKQKSWLKDYLLTFKNGDEKRALLGALRK